MRKLPLLRQGQAFDYKIINQIISAINESIIEQPKYQSMMNDLAAVTNNYTTSIESFISRYKDVVENTPTLHELLVAYAALQDKANGSTQSTMVNVPYVNLQFVYNKNDETGIFELNGNTPSVGSVRVENGQCVIAGVKNGGAFTDTKIFVNCGTADDLSFLCLDLIRGPQGPTGPQGTHGDTGAAGKDGENGRLVKLKGKIEAAGETIGTVLDGFASEPTIEIGDGWVYENAEGGPVVYVYVGEGAIGVESEYPKFITIKTMRGPAGPAGPASEVDICFSETDESDSAKDEYDKLDPNKDYYFMWIKVVTANMTDEQKNNLPYNKIRIRQRKISIKPHASFTYEVKEGGETVERQTDEKGVTVVQQSIDDTTEKQKYIFRFKDQKEISDVDFDEEGHIVFERRYVNANAPADPLTTEGIVHTPTLYFDGSSYMGSQTTDSEIVRDMAREASVKYKSFAIYKTPNGQDLQIWEINVDKSGNIQVTYCSSLFMNIVSHEGVWSTKQKADNYIPLKTSTGCDARAIPDFNEATNARPEYGKTGSSDDYACLCFNGEELIATENYLVVKAFNFEDDNGDWIYKAYISDGNQWIKILETKSVHGEKQYLKVENNKLYHAYIKHDQTAPQSGDQIHELFDFSTFVATEVKKDESAPVTGNAVYEYIADALGASADDIANLETLINQYQNSGLGAIDTSIKTHDGSSASHQDIRTSLDSKANSVHNHESEDWFTSAMDLKAHVLHSHTGYVATRTLNQSIKEHCEDTSAHQDIRNSVTDLYNSKADVVHAHTEYATIGVLGYYVLKTELESDLTDLENDLTDLENDLTDLENDLKNCVTKAQVNAMFDYSVSTKTLTITTL